MHNGLTAHPILAKEPHMTDLLRAAEERRRRVEGPPRFKRSATSTILKAHEAPMRWLVPGFLGEGLTILAGRQKIGKSWLAMDWAIAVASGGKAMGSVACEAGDVLYIDLQNGRRRMRTRIETLF